MYYYHAALARDFRLFLQRFCEGGFLRDDFLWPFLTAELAFFIPNNSSISSNLPLSALVARLNANPFAPLRPVRPIRWI